MSDEALSAETIEQPPADPTDAPQVPFAFGCALWVPVFAVLLYFFTWFLRPRVTVGAPEELDEPEG
ncbi:MAG: hypothetical protein EP329_15890 [Deltaproteobacteria bacterium]|nr:MAG: hypothetical protein EP329_15890 [Deltaproteobacteria bacterium]